MENPMRETVTSIKLSRLICKLEKTTFRSNLFRQKRIHKLKDSLQMFFEDPAATTARPTLHHPLRPSTAHRPRL